MAENQKHILVIVAGFAGSGKSTLADKLAQEIGAKCIHASGLLKELQQKKFSEINPHACEHNSGWWESNEGKKYMSQRLKDGSMDKELDEQLLKIIAGAKEKNENLVLDSWTMPWLSKEGFKIWLETSEEARAERIAGRDGIDYNDALEKLRERDAQTTEIYKKLYGFTLGEDMKPFHFIIPTDNIDEERVFSKAEMEVRKHYNLKYPDSARKRK